MEQDIWILHEQTVESHIGIVIFYTYEVQIKWRKTILWVRMRDLGWEAICKNNAADHGARIHKYYQSFNQDT